MKPLVIDLFSGLHGWGRAFLAEGWQVIGFDLVDMCSEFGYPKPEGDHELVLQDIHTVDGKQFRDADFIVASPPCTQFSYRGRYGRKKNLAPPYEGIALFEACFRIRKEASSSNCEPIPMVVENVVWAQQFVGPAKAHWGSQYLWGDVPAILPVRVPGDPTKGNADGLRSQRFGSKTLARRRCTAELSMIPYPLAQHIARVMKPDISHRAETPVRHKTQSPD